MSIEAMKQWLAALIDLTNEMIDQDFVNQGMDAITSLRQAIEQAEKQKPVAWKLEAGKAVWFEKTDPAATSALPSDYVVTPLYPSPQSQQAQKQEPWVWMPAPTKTLWANDMVEADLAIDKDHTVSIYCERDQTEKVETMLSAQPQRPWVGLTDGQYRDIADQVIATLEDRKGVIDLCFEQEIVDEIMLEVAETIKTVTEAKLQEKNT